MVNMGELFKYSRMKNIPMDRVPLNEKEYLSSMVVAGDLLFARQSLVLEGAGQCSIFIEDAEEVCFESHLIRCRLNKKIANPLFYYYFFSSKLGKQVINAIVEQGAGAAGIRGSDLSKVLVPDIDIVAQNNIVRVVDNIDSKIELNRQINQTLESMAQAIFQSWFVDFDPVKAKIAAREQWQILTDGERREWLNEMLNKQAFLKTCLSELTANGEQSASETLYLNIAAMTAISSRNETSLADMSTDEFAQLYKTASIFPERLVESELGEIPEGWRFDELRKIAHFSAERIDLSELTLESYVSTENMLENKKGITIASSLPTVKTVPKFEPGQILISNIRPYFMKIWLASFVGGRSNDVLGINSKEPEGIQYLYNLLYQDRFFNFMMTTSKGAKMPRGDKEAIMSWICVQPTFDIKSAYSEIVEKFVEIIVNKKKENGNLENARDTLLPKLLSGELDVSSLTELSDIAPTAMDV